MEAKKYLIGIDIGTSGIKLQAMSDKLEVLGNHYSPLELHQDGEIATQSPAKIWYEVRTGIIKLQSTNSGHCEGIVFSSAMHSLILLDMHNNCLTDSITWADRRSAAIAMEVRSTAKGSELFQNTGTPIHAMSPLMKIKWFLMNNPSLHGQTRMFAGIKEYVIWRLTGCWIVDPSIASATGLFNIHHGRWDTKALEFAGINASQLPTITSGKEKIDIEATCAEALHLPTDCKVLPGASDGCLANHAMPAMDTPYAVLTVGTSAAVRINLTKLSIANHGNLFTYWLEKGKYVMGGPSNNGGIVLEWFRAKYAPDHSISQLFALLESEYPKTDLIFYPWLLGERAPFWNDWSMVGFEGNTETASIAQLYATVLEGVLFNIRMILEGIQIIQPQIGHILLTGGLSRSKVFAQLAANVLKLETHCHEDTDASLIGALKMGFDALNWPWQASYDINKPNWAFTPKQTAYFDEKYARFKSFLAIKQPYKST